MPDVSTAPQPLRICDLIDRLEITLSAVEDKLFSPTPQQSTDPVPSTNIGLRIMRLEQLLKRMQKVNEELDRM